MARVLKYVSTTGSSAIVVSLAPEGSTAVNKVGFLRLRTYPAGSGNQILQVKLYSKPENAASDWESGLNATAPSSGDKVDNFLLLDAAGTTAEKSVELGQNFAGGYSSDVHRSPLATHVVIQFPTGTTGPDLLIEGY